MSGASRVRFRPARDFQSLIESVLYCHIRVFRSYPEGSFRTQNSRTNCSNRTLAERPDLLPFVLSYRVPLVPSIRILRTTNRDVGIGTTTKVEPRTYSPPVRSRISRAGFHDRAAFAFQHAILMSGQPRVCFFEVLLPGFGSLRRLKLVGVVGRKEAVCHGPRPDTAVAGRLPTILSRGFGALCSETEGALSRPSRGRVAP